MRSSWRFILATDLDGTFLGGSEMSRAILYDWIRQRRDEVGLVFVSGRDPMFITELCGAGEVPWPDYVIGDVGTTIARVTPPEIQPIPELEEEIATLWNDRGPLVREALDGMPGLALQPTPFRYRVSYDYDPHRFDPRAIEVVAELGLDHLISDNRYFDVLPKGVSKGPSLSRLIRHLGVQPDRVLAAGDTLNDLSMLEIALPGVVVGGAEPELVDRTTHAPMTHHARGIGAAGIIEAIQAFDLHPEPPKGAP